MNLTDELQRLHQLYESGALSDAEYRQAKSTLLNNPPAPRVERPITIRSEGNEALGEAARTWVNFQIGMAIIGLVIAAIFFFAIWLPGWNEMGQNKKQFDRDWEQRRKEQEEFKKKFDEDWNRNRGF